MKKILIIPSQMLPMPPVQGGAVQTLIQNFIEWNEHSRIYILEVCSPKYEGTDLKNKYRYTTYNYFNTSETKIKTMIRKGVRRLTTVDLCDRYIKEIIDKFKYVHFDAILVENVDRYGYILKKTFECPIILHLHNEYFDKYKINNNKYINSYDGIITVSNYIRSTITDLYNKNIDVLINGVDTSQFNYVKCTKFRNAYRNRMGILKDDIAFIFAARLCEDKGAYETIKAYSDVCKDYPNTKLIIVGSTIYGKNVTDDYLIKLKNIALNIRDNIIFTGYISHSDIHKYYAAADIGILTSNFNDPCPLTVIEYICMGLPEIVTRCGGIPEIANEKTAMLINNDSSKIQEIKEAMEEMIVNYNKRNEMHENTLLQSCEYTSDNYCKKLSKILDKYI